MSLASLHNLLQNHTRCLKEAGKTIANFLRLHSVQPHRCHDAITPFIYQTLQTSRFASGTTLAEPALRPFPFLSSLHYWPAACCVIQYVPGLTFFVFIRLHACGPDLTGAANRNLSVSCGEAKCICICGEWCHIEHDMDCLSACPCSPNYMRS